LNSLHWGFGKGFFGTMMVVSMSGKQAPAPGILRPPMVLRICNKLHQAGSVSVRGLAGASRMDSILRVSRRVSSDLGKVILLLFFLSIKVGYNFFC